MPKPQIEYVVLARAVAEGKPEVIAEQDRHDTFKEAVDHRNWIIGHMPWAVECWVEKLATYNVGRVGAVVKRKAKP